MKKFFIAMTVMMLSVTSANAQLANILGKAASAVQSSSNNSVVQSLVGVLSDKLIPSESQIQGTWMYQEPAVMFTSSNMLKNAAATAVSKKVEAKLQSYLTKVGITKGKMSITYKADKTFTVNRGGKTVASGTYAMNGKEVVMTFKGKKNPCKVTPQLDNGSLVVVMDATKLKTFMEGIGSSISQLSTVTSLLKQVDGMKLGIRLSK